MNSTMRRDFLLFGTAFLLALFVRFAFLGRVPLSDAEAALALQSMALSRGEPVALGPHPGYLLLSAAWMFLFGTGNAVARFWPALGGALVALAPLFFRRQIGRRTAIWLAFFLAIDPGLVALSRQAGSLPLAVSFLLLAVGLWLSRRVVWAGVMAGMALLSGPQIWPGMFALGIAVWVYGPRAGADPAARESTKADLRRGGVALLAVLLLVGTMFFAIPRGISAMAASLPAYLETWVRPSGQPLTLLAAGLLFYGMMPVVFGIVGLVLGWKQQLNRFLGVWALIALVLALAPQGRSVESLAWVVLPLWVLTARQAEHFFRVPASARAAVFGQAALAAAILTFISFDLLAISDSLKLRQEITPELIALVGALVLLAATSLLVAWGWSGRVAVYGVVWAVLAVLLSFTISAAWNGAGLSGRWSAELWRPGPQFVDEDLLTATVRNFENWNIGSTYSVDVAVVATPSPALRWALRDHAPVQYVDFLPSSSAPAVVITADQPEVELSATYRGQNMVLGRQPVWTAATANDWLRWLYFREASYQDQMVVLWARTDLFPADAVTEQNGTPPETGEGFGVE